MQILSNPNFNFIKWRWHALVLSSLVIGIGLVTMIMRGGPPMGIDFTGGTVVVVQFAQPTSEGVVRDAIATVAPESVVQRYGTGGNQILIRLPLLGDQGPDSLEVGVKRIEDALRAAGLVPDPNEPFPQKDVVGPVIGQDLQRKAILATLTALGGILVYIGLRFRFSFAIGAIVATFHDILVTLVFLTWFQYDLSLNIIAAILTITGYSVNDTIVVFDRVRENQRLMRREPLEQIVNKSVNQTLARTIITAGATFLAVLALYLFGGEVLRGFAFTMLVGIVTGTYSTVFIASAIAIILSRRPPAQGVVKSEPRLQRA